MDGAGPSSWALEEGAKYSAAAGSVGFGGAGGLSAAAGSAGGSPGLFSGIGSGGSGMRAMALDIFARSPGSSLFRRVDPRKSLKTVLSSRRSSSVRTPWPSDSFVRAASTFSRCSGLSGDSGAVNLPRLAASSARSWAVNSIGPGDCKLRARARRKKRMLAIR